MPSSLINSFTSGEISEDAWDRTDIQPVGKGCKEATNLVLRVAGPLGKRRGFWDVAAVDVEANKGRLIPFRRSIDDALMLELGNETCVVWQANGSPLLNGGVQVRFDTPWTTAQLDGLRFKQVADVIYVRHRDGLQPHTIVRHTTLLWTCEPETFPNGPWLAENGNAGLTITVAADGATTVLDLQPGTGAGAILADGAVTLTASGFTFDPGQVGAYFRLRQNTGAPGVKTWSTGYRPPTTGCFCASAGRVYTCNLLGTGALTSGVDQAVTTPPVVTDGSQSDGGNHWGYMHDGAGVVQITSWTDATHVQANVIATIPVPHGTVTSCWAEVAYSDFRGWPRMWPSAVEERLVEGATAANLDMLDMTETAGFDTGTERFSPGLGNGSVVDTDAIRRRVGDDGGEILWSQFTSFLLLGTASGEYIASGGLFGNPITPSSIVVRPMPECHGSADVYPARGPKGLFFVTRGGQAVRRLSVDLQQNFSGDDLSVLAQHIARREFKQLAWIPWPDGVLWTRLGDGGLAAFTNHDEQQVRGWTRQALPGGFIVEDIVTLPGPGRLETLWMIVSRTKGGVTQRRIWMQSQASDALFMDGAEYYSGAPVTTITGLARYNGETVRVLADGVFADLPCSGGAITLGAPASVVQVGLGYQTRFESLSLDMGALAAGLNLRQRPTQIVAHLYTTTALVGVGDAAVREQVSTRTAADTPAMTPKSVITQPTALGSTTRTPTIVIEEDTPYDHVIYSLRPIVQVGGG